MKEPYTPELHAESRPSQGVSTGNRQQEGLDAANREVASLERAVASLLDRAEEPEGLWSANSFIGYGMVGTMDVLEYSIWLEQGRQKETREIEAMLEEMESWATRPTFSVLVPVHKPPIKHLISAVESVRSQLYPEWQLSIYDDASNNPEITAYLERVASKDPRVRVGGGLESLNIAAATNAALSMATGEFITFLDHDDMFNPSALLRAAVAIHGDDEADVLYSDEDRVDEQDRRSAPYFKPDWSPDLLTSHPYMTHGLFIRRSLVLDSGGLRTEFDGGQDYDLILRTTELARRIIHIPEVLYHWRAIEGSTAADELAKPWAHDAARRALQEALKRRGEEAEAEEGFYRWAFRIKRRIKGSPLVSIIVPFRDQAAHLARCIESIDRYGGYENYEILLIDNRSWEPETVALLERFGGNPRIRVIEFDHPFNWAALNKWAAGKSRGDHLLFINNDVEGISDGWLEAMLEHSQRPEVGAVGARLIYPDGRVQHAGVVMGMGAIAAHAFWFHPPGYNAYFGQDLMIRNYSAVTGACLMTRADTFAQMSGFDESLGVAYNDIDYCLRLRESGALIVYTPFAELVHHESITRGATTDTPETRIMLERWGDWLERGDPYYNPNLSLRKFDFGLRPEKETPPWRDLKSAQGS